MNQKHRHRLRSGAVLIAVLAATIVSIGLVANSFRSATILRREIRTNLQRQQAEWLLTAGIQRARRQLASASEYTGETWDASADLAEYQSALVTILHQVTGSGQPRILVTARVAANASDDWAIQLSHSFSIPSAPTANSPKLTTPSERTGDPQ